MGDIAKQVKVSKSTISYWVRDIVLSEFQKNKLNKNGHSVDAIEKRRTSRLANTASRHKIIFDRAIAEAPLLSKNPLWCVGVALYWGEGGKTQNLVRISNSDPKVITTMMGFFKDVCGVVPAKFRGHVHIFAHSDIQNSEKYWSQVSGIPITQFLKSYQKNSAASLNKRFTLPHGTVQIYVLDTKLFFRIMGWIEYIKQQYD